MIIYDVDRVYKKAGVVCGMCMVKGVAVSVYVWETRLCDRTRTTGCQEAGGAPRASGGEGDTSPRIALTLSTEKRDANTNTLSAYRTRTHVSPTTDSSLPVI